MSDPLEGIWADVEIVRAAVLSSVEHGIWVSTGGTTGCAQCVDAPNYARPLTFRERVERGHLDCAEELARGKGARGVRDSLTCGHLDADLRDVLVDPRLGAWRANV